MPVVQIIAGHEVTYLPDGFTPTIYDDQELYEVTDLVARGMVERGWARLVDPAKLTEPEPEPTASKRR